MIFPVIPFDIMGQVVVAGQVEVLEGLGGIVPLQVDIGARDALRHRACRVQCAHLGRQHLADAGGVRDAPVGDLVADAPHHDGRVVAVAHQHRGEVALPVVLEELRIIVDVLGLLPHVRKLIHHQQAQLVAGVQEIAGRRIMGAADGIEAGVLELANAAVFGRAESGRAE